MFIKINTTGKKLDFIDFIHLQIEGQKTAKGITSSTQFLRLGNVVSSILRKGPDQITIPPCQDLVISNGSSVVILAKLS